MNGMSILQSYTVLSEDVYKADQLFKDLDSGLDSPPDGMGPEKNAHVDERLETIATVRFLPLWRKRFGFEFPRIQKPRISENPVARGGRKEKNSLVGTDG